MMSRVEFRKAIIEFTGSQWVVRVWRDAPRRLEWAYGDTEVEAWENLRAGKAIIEFTGSQWVVRVWRDAPRRLEWAYGDTEVEAWENLRAAPTVVPIENIEEVVALAGAGVRQADTPREDFDDE